MTMLHLWENGVLQEFEAFDSRDLPARVNALYFVHEYTNLAQRMLDRGKLEPAVEQALARIVRRSKRARPLFQLRSRIRQVVDRYL